MKASLNSEGLVCKQCKNCAGRSPLYINCTKLNCDCHQIEPTFNTPRIEPEKMFPKNEAEWKNEDMPRRLHEWYLESLWELEPENYNPNAVKDYDELTEQQKFIDRYIAQKIKTRIIPRVLELRNQEILTLITKEIVIAHSEDKETSRLTSLYNKVSEMI